MRNGSPQAIRVNGGITVDSTVVFSHVRKGLSRLPAGCGHARLATGRARSGRME